MSAAVLDSTGPLALALRSARIYHAALLVSTLRRGAVMPYEPRAPGPGLVFALLWAALLVPPGTEAAEPEPQPQRPPLEAQRNTFLAAEAALKAGPMDRYREFAAGLTGYPLYPYLRYDELSRAPAGPTDAEVRQFLADYPDSHLADRLRATWLTRLAREGRWAEYADAYRLDGSDQRQCLYRRALLATGRRTEALAGLEPLWLRAEAGLAACGPVFDAWAAGGLTPELGWQRIALALGADRPKLAADVGRYLPPADTPYLDLWLALHRDPSRASDLATFAEPHPRRGDLIAHAVARLAARSPQAAAEAWDRLRATYPIAAPAAGAAETAIGLALAEAGDAGGFAHLDQISPSPDNTELQGRRLRIALKLGDWSRVAAWVAAMPEGEWKADLWLYWQARAEEALGRDELAEDLYRQAAGARSLWGFLAAERAGLPYRFDGRPTPADPGRVARIATNPTLGRILELRALDRGADMRREWARLTADLGPDDLMAAAVVARGLGWPDQAIRTLARSGYWDDLELRFPLGYRDLVRAEAAATSLPDAWIYAVLREESTFDPGAGSPAGAVGLMQLMPDTARAVANAAAQRPPSRGDLLDPGTNVALGSAYLAAMGARYGAHPALATAAYNAGPHRVDKWLPASPMPADVWIATIPFRETRDYVRRVLAYRVIYADRLGICPAPLATALGPVASALAENRLD
jgi:soluble lytic murein transglycosylase